MKFRTVLLLIGLSLVVLIAACSSQPPPSSVTTAPTASPTATNKPAFDHAAFDKILATYVNEQGWVDYAGLQNNRAALDSYLVTLAEAKPQDFPNDAERLAFWINAYNAHTLTDVLDSVYKKHKGVKEVENEFFRGKKHRVGGQELTLDQIEEPARKLDPRTHFAVVCASTSCPKLQRFAYTASQLDEQLNRVAREFLADSSRGLRVERERNKVVLSPIFKWYAADFTGGSSLLARAKAELSGSEVLEYVKKFAPADAVQFISEKKPGVEYLNYDWSLNAQETHR